MLILDRAGSFRTVLPLKAFNLCIASRQAEWGLSASLTDKHKRMSLPVLPLSYKTPKNSTFLFKSYDIKRLSKVKFFCIIFSCILLFVSQIK